MENGESSVLVVTVRDQANACSCAVRALPISTRSPMGFDRLLTLGPISTSDNMTSSDDMDVTLWFACWLHERRISPLWESITEDSSTKLRCEPTNDERLLELHTTNTFAIVDCGVTPFGLACAEEKLNWTSNRTQQIRYDNTLSP